MNLKKQVSGVVGGFVGVARGAARRLGLVKKGWAKKLNAGVSRQAVVEALESRQMLAAPAVAFADFFLGEGTAAGDQAHVRVVVSDGTNTYVLTEFGGKGSIQTAGGTTSVPDPAGNGAFVVTKLNSSGAVSWSQTFGAESGTDVSHLVYNKASDHVVLAGDFFGTSMDFDPGAGSVKIPASGGADGFFLNLSASTGALDTFGIFNGPGTVDLTAVAAEPTTGELFFTGSFTGSVNFNPVGNSTLDVDDNQNFFLRLNGKTHSPLALTGMDGNDSFFPSAIVPGLDGEAFLLGVQTAAGDFNGDGIAEIVPMGNSDILGLRFSGDGTLLDSNSIGGPGVSVSNFLAAPDGAGGFFALIDGPVGKISLNGGSGADSITLTQDQVDVNAHVAARYGRTLVPIWNKLVQGVDASPNGVFVVTSATSAGTGTGLVDFAVGGGVRGGLDIGGTVVNFSDPTKVANPVGFVVMLSGVNGALFGDPYQTSNTSATGNSIVTNLTRQGSSVIADLFLQGSVDLGPNQAGFDRVVPPGDFEHAVIKVGAASGPAKTPADLSAVVSNAWALSPTTTVTIKNSGQTDAGSFFFTGFLSKDGLLDEGDISIFSGDVVSLAAGASTKQVVTASLPGGLAPGSYQVLVKLDAGNEVAESNESNNTVVGAPVVTITGPAQPDLKVSTLTGFTGVVGPGQIVTGSISFMNAGKALAGANVAQIVISHDKIFGNGDDILFCEIDVPEIAPGKTYAKKFSGEINSAASSGKYYVLARVDNFDDVVEVSDLNNTFTGSLFSVGRPVLSLAGPAAKLQETGGKGTFVFTRTGGSTGVALEVPFEVSGTGVRGVDYELKVGTTVLTEDFVTIPVKAGSLTVGIFALGDSAIEGEENARLSLLPSLGATPNYTLNSLKSVGTAVILDDEPTVKLTSVSTKIAEAAGTATFTVARSGGSNKQALVVDFDVFGTATQGSDFKLVSSDGKTVLGNSVTIPANAPSVTFKAIGIDDQKIEGTEDLTIHLMPVDGPPTYSIDKLKHEATVLVLDNEPMVKITANPTKTSETNGSVSFTVTRSGGSNKEALVVGFTPDGSAVGGSDYKLMSPNGKFELSNFVTIPANAASVTFKALIIDDNAIEGNETFGLILTTSIEDPAYTLDPLKFSAGATITDNEPMVTLSSTTKKTSETKGTASFTVARTGGSTKSALEVFFFTFGTAGFGSDYTLVSNDGKSPLGGSVTIPAGAASVNFKALITDDSKIEGSENFTVHLEAAPGEPTYTISPTKHEALVEVTDNEPVVTLTSTTKVTSETKGTASFTVARTGGSTSSPLQVFFTTLGVAGLGSDFNLVSNDGKSFLSNSVTIPAGAASVNFKALIIDDAKIEGTEKFTVHLTAAPGEPTYTISPTKHEALVEVTDNEPTVSVVATKPNASETSPAVNKGQFKFARTGGSTSSPLTVNFTIASSTSKGTATFGTDYSLSAPAASKLGTSGSGPVTGSITFAAGVSSVLVDLTVLGDSNLEEGSEQVALTLLSSSSFALEPGKGAATVNIADGKAAPPAAGSPMSFSGYGTSFSFLTHNVVSKLGPVAIFGGTFATGDRTGNFTYTATTGTGASTDKQFHFVSFNLIAVSGKEGTVGDLTLTYTGARPADLVGKTVQFFAPGTSGTLGKFSFFSTGASGTTASGTFKVV